MKSFIAYLADKQSHKIVASIAVTADGYLTALQKAKEVCDKNHPTCYVSSVQ